MDGDSKCCAHAGLEAAVPSQKLWKGRLPDCRLGGRHCRKWVTNITKISVPRVERCCQPAASNTYSILLTNSSSSLQVSPADVLTSVPTVNPTGE